MGRGVSTILHELLSLDYRGVSDRIRSFILSRVEDAHLDGVVLGMSGGLDSTVTAYLTAEALPNNRVLALIMPDYHTTPQGDVKDAEEVAKKLGVKRRLIDITPIHEAFLKHLKGELVAEGNLRARIRMCILYYHANLERRLVIGTGDRSELLIGYFTKYGDGGVDILPLGGLYKTQVRELGRHLGVPNKIVEKRSSPRLWAGQTAEGELGLPYETIDPILHLLYDRGLKPDEAAERIGDRQAVDRVLEMYRFSGHKRSTPTICEIPQPTGPA